MNLEKLIAEAWEQERAPYKIIPNHGGGEGPFTIFNLRAPEFIFSGKKAECERHLSALCAIAVLKALAAEGYVVTLRSEPIDHGG